MLGCKLSMAASSGEGPLVMVYIDSEDFVVFSFLFCKLSIAVSHRASCLEVETLFRLHVF